MRSGISEYRRAMRSGTAAIAAGCVSEGSSNSVKPMPSRRLMAYASCASLITPLRSNRMPSRA